MSAKEFAALCADSYSSMACIASGITNQPDIADDIVQQAITIAIEKNPQLESREQFMAWLATIVKNCALNHRRKKSRRKTYATDPVNLNQVVGKTNSHQPINQSSGKLLPLQNSFDDRVKNALDSLSENARSCLLLRTIERLSYKEISALMQIPEGTAMNLVHRSKQKLRERLMSDLPETKGKEK